MQSPFIRIETDNNDITIYHNLDSLIKSMEVTDIRNNEYKVYDGAGYPLKINLYPKTGQKLTDEKFSRNVLIKIESTPNDISKNNEVCELLIEHLRLHNISFDKTKSTNLDYLLLRVIIEIDLPFILNKKTFF